MTVWLSPRGLNYSIEEFLGQK